MSFIPPKPHAERLASDPNSAPPQAEQPVQYVLQEARPPISSLGIASMVLGVLAPGGIVLLFALSLLTNGGFGRGFGGNVWFFVIPSVVFAALSLLLAAVAKKRIEAGKERGDGFAAVGILLGVLTLLAAAFISWQFFQAAGQISDKVSIEELMGDDYVEAPGDQIEVPLDETGIDDMLSDPVTSSDQPE